MSQITPDEFERYRQALRDRNWDQLRELEQAEVLPFCDDTPEDRRNILALTPEELTAVVEFEQQQMEDDTTVFFVPAYYLEQAVEPFLAYMQLWPEQQRNLFMSNLPGFVKDQFTVDHPIVTAYLQYFPQDRAAQEIIKGGRIALEQINYPAPYSDYTRSRSPTYQAEQELAWVRQQKQMGHWPPLMGFKPEEIATLETRLNETTVPACCRL